MKTKHGSAILDLKNLTSDGVFSGYGSVFGNRDAYGDIVEAGAFARSLSDHRRRGSRPKMFWQHDPHQPIGSWTDLAEDGKGLWVEGRLNMDVQRGREAHALLKAGDIDGLSIGYHTVTAENDEKAGVVRLRALDLVEVSVVSLGANDRATVDAVKAAKAKGYRDRIAAGERLTEREWEDVLKEFLTLSNSEAERAVRVHGLRIGQGEPDEPGDGGDFLTSLWDAIRTAPIIDEAGETIDCTGA